MALSATELKKNIYIFHNIKSNTYLFSFAVWSPAASVLSNFFPVLSVTRRNTAMETAFLKLDIFVNVNSNCLNLRKHCETRFRYFKNYTKISLDIYFGKFRKDASRKVFITAGMREKQWCMWWISLLTATNETVGRWMINMVGNCTETWQSLECNISCDSVVSETIK